VSFSESNHDGSQPDTETLLRRVVEIIGNAKSMPLSNSVIISKDEVLELLEDGIERLPPELQQARWMLKEREEYLARVKSDGDEILDAARVRAERMVQRTEIVRQAQHTAERTSQRANDEASRLRLEAEDYCDQKLAAFEIVLERTMKQVQGGRQRLRVTPLPPAEAGDLVGELDGSFTGAFGDPHGDPRGDMHGATRAVGAGGVEDEGFFDQDRV